jgi:hypothetical protein
MSATVSTMMLDGLTSRYELKSLNPVAGATP